MHDWRWLRRNGPRVLTMQTPSLKSPLNADVAIDSSTQDNGYLQFARENNRLAAKLAAATDVVVLANKKSHNAIIGHGTEGTIHAGSGMVLGTADQLIDNSNVKNIGFNKLGKSTALWIYACHTGAGEKGAQLLFEIANQTECPVYAPNGFIFLNDNGRFSLQTNAKWQVAFPGSNPPDPLPLAPTPEGLLSLAMELPFGGTIPWGGIRSWRSRRRWDRVTKLTYDLKGRPTVHSAQPASEKPMSGSLSSDDARSVVEALGLSGPYRIKGVPGARHTGDLEFDFGDGPTKYIVLNNRLIEEVQTCLFYFTSKDVSTILQ
jgi:hypothetical protein